jgi:hypothetical protein
MLQFTLYIIGSHLVNPIDSLLISHIDVLAHYSMAWPERTCTNVPRSKIDKVQVTKHQVSRNQKIQAARLTVNDNNMYRVLSGIQTKLQLYGAK